MRVFFKLKATNPSIIIGGCPNKELGYYNIEAHWPYHHHEYYRRLAFYETKLSASLFTRVHVVSICEICACSDLRISNADYLELFLISLGNLWDG